MGHRQCYHAAKSGIPAQAARVLAVLRTHPGRWFSTMRISELTGDPQHSASARLSDLRLRHGQPIESRTALFGDRRIAIFRYPKSAGSASPLNSDV